MLKHKALFHRHVGHYGLLVVVTKMAQQVIALLMVFPRPPMGTEILYLKTKQNKTNNLIRSRIELLNNNLYFLVKKGAHCSQRFGKTISSSLESLQLLTSVIKASKTSTYRNTTGNRNKMKR